MGEEDCLPTVEESTEPPIRAQQSGNYHGPTTTGHLATPPTADPATNGDATLPPFLTAAHTLTAEEVANALGVDVQYDLTIPFFYF